MTAFSRALLVDSDQIVLRSYDSIFDGYDPLAVGPSNFRADKAFATGTMLLRPDFGEYTRLLALLGTLRPEYDNADMVSGRPSRLAVMVQLMCLLSWVMPGLCHGAWVSICSALAAAASPALPLACREGQGLPLVGGGA